MDVPRSTRPGLEGGGTTTREQEGGKRKSGLEPCSITEGRGSTSMRMLLLCFCPLFYVCDGDLCSGLHSQLCVITTLCYFHVEI